VAFYHAGDIPGENTGGSDIKLFTPIGDTVQSVGAPIGVVIASNQGLADNAAALVVATYGEIPGTAPMIGIEKAIAAQSFYPLSDDIQNLTLLAIGDADAAMKTSAHVFKGHISAGAQIHFYMEAQTATAKPLDGNLMEVICGRRLSDYVFVIPLYTLEIVIF
jgi:xanthine dehydrogenase molybdopterin-binding subunit B